MKPTLSVLITYFNEGELLRECLESVMRQSDAPDEILIYDDASSLPADQFLPEGFTGRVLRGSINRGPCFGRNRLLTESRSDYVHFHDADDWFRPEWCLRVRGVLESSAPEAVLTEISSFEAGRLKSERVLDLSRLKKDPDMIRFSLHGSLLVPAGTYHRRRIVQMGGFNESLWQSEDFEFGVRLALAGVRCAILEEPLVCIRIRPEGRSQDHQAVWSSALQAMEMHAKEIPSRYRSDLADKAAWAGSVLFRLGDRAQAHMAFERALQWGKPEYTGQRRIYRWVARVCGPEWAERVESVYGRLLK